LETIGVKRQHSLLEVLNVNLAHMRSCIPLEVHLINVFCVVIVVKKCIMASSGSRFLYCIEARYLCCLRPKLHVCAASVQRARWR